MGWIRNQAFTLAPLTVAAVAVATLTTVALSIYHVTRDPSWRPLAVSIEQRFESEGRPPVQVTIHWPSRLPPQGALAMARYVDRALTGKGVEARFTTRPTEAETGTIVYRVGSSTIGPMPIAAATEGIGPAVAAWQRQAAP